MILLHYKGEELMDREYKDEIIMDTLKKEVIDKLSEEAWNSLVKDIGIPDIENEHKCGCKTMRAFMSCFDKTIDHETAKSILTNVRHGLKREMFSSAKEKYAKYNNIDEFIKADLEENIQRYKHCLDTGKDFYGQHISQEGFDFLMDNPNILTAVHEGSDLYITAIPAELESYIHETDLRKKRYYACHCPFARESILSEDGEVSATLCLCSLGHAKVMWDAIFDMDLKGEVIESALKGDLLCRYVIHLPKEC